MRVYLPQAFRRAIRVSVEVARSMHCFLVITGSLFAIVSKHYAIKLGPVMTVKKKQNKVKYFPWKVTDSEVMLYIHNPFLCLSGK